MIQKNVDLSALQLDLSRQIIGLIRDASLVEGSPLKEERLAHEFRVSRTPVRSALAYLATLGIARNSGRGYVVGDLSARNVENAADAVASATSPNEKLNLYLGIIESRVAGTLENDVSEADLMRRFRVGRPLLQRVLTELAELGVVERRPAIGWRFLPAVTDSVARRESYRWRMLVEPAALLEPGYRVQADWVAPMRERHVQMLSNAWNETSILEFYELNAAFHEGLAAGANNRFLLLAVQQQTRLRRLANYNLAVLADQALIRQRTEKNASEHIEILDRVAVNDFEVAAALMRRHLARASEVWRPDT